jgi:hypothetical protein
VPDSIEGNKVRNDADTCKRLHKSERSGISHNKCGSFYQRPAHGAHWVNNVEGFDND